MKRIAVLTFTVIICCLVLVGCGSGAFQRESDPRDIYVEHIDTSWNEDDEFSQNIASVRGAAVVSVISNSIVYENIGNSAVQQIFSGIIINSQGYVLTSSQAAHLPVEAGSGRHLSVYAVLPEIYNVKRQVKLSLVDYNDTAGLAIFKFYDNFYYYADEDKSEAVPGFQVYAEFSGKDAVTGERCVTIGNSLGNALGNVIGADNIDEVELTIMNGIISDARADATVLDPLLFGGDTYEYILTSSPVNFDMYGGALFDENGYLLGVLAFKIGYESSTGNSSDSGYFDRVAAAYPINFVTAYIDSVATKIQAPIPYTVTSPETNTEVV